MPNVFYDQKAIQELLDRTSYEAWFLEVIYKLVAEELFPKFPDDIIYPLGGSPPLIGTHGGASNVLGDWRSGFLAAGAPLVFISTFKLLDMFLEWVLERNGCKPTHSFTQKIQMLSGPITYPPVVQQRPWLLERLRSLYAALKPLRGTIIHSRHFEATGGELSVSSSTGGAIGSEVQISTQALRTFAALCLSTLRYVEGAWPLDSHKENLLLWQLDQLASLHQMPVLGQKEPYRTVVRVFLKSNDPCVVDVESIRKELEALYPQHSLVFDLRVLLVQTGRVTAAYLFPWAILDQVRNLTDASPYSTEVPGDVDPRHYAAA